MSEPDSTKTSIAGELTPRGYRRVGFGGLVVGGIEIGYGFAQMLAGEMWFMWLGSAALVLWSSRVALIRGGAIGKEPRIRMDLDTAKTNRDTGNAR